MDAASLLILAISHLAADDQRATESIVGSPLHSVAWKDVTVG